MCSPQNLSRSCRLPCPDHPTRGAEGSLQGSLSASSGLDDHRLGTSRIVRRAARALFVSPCISLTLHPPSSPSSPSSPSFPPPISPSSNQPAQLPPLAVEARCVQGGGRLGRDSAQCPGSLGRRRHGGLVERRVRSSDRDPERYEACIIVDLLSMPADQLSFPRASGKLQLQLSSASESREFSGPIDCARSIVRTQGLGGLWKGLPATLAFRSCARPPPPLLDPPLCRM